MTVLDELLARVRAGGAGVKDALAIAGEHAARVAWVPNPGPQTEAYLSPADELFYGGQAGGGKTDLGIGLALTRHQRSLILRRIRTDAIKLVERVETIVGHRDGFNGQYSRWKLPDGRHIDFGGCEQESDKHRYKGNPKDLIVFDEGSDFLYSQYRFITAWLRSENPNQRCRIIVASNPPLTAAGLWVIQHWAPWLDKNHPRPARPGELRWYLAGDEGDIEVDGPGPHDIRGRQVHARSRTFIPGAVEDNPDYARGDYVSVLEGLPEELRRAYREGDFGVGQRDDDFQAIPTAWIEAAQQRWTDKPPHGMAMTAMAVDVAPGGGDQRVICWRHGGWYGRFQAEKIVDRTGRQTAADVVRHRRDNCPVVVDLGGGWGGDALIALKDNGIVVAAFNGIVATPSARTRDGKLKLRNKRALAVWRFREALDPSQEDGSVVALPPDPELKADLAAYRWENTVGGILIEEKQKMRERLGRSPDKGDAAVMCLEEGQTAVRSVARNRQGALPVHANIGHAALKRRQG